MPKFPQILTTILLALGSAPQAFCEDFSSKVNAEPLTLTPDTAEGLANLSREQEIEKQELEMLLVKALKKSPSGVETDNF